MISALTSVGFPKIKVTALIHPTEFVTNNFTVDKFMKNSNRQIVQIGAWLRDVYAIYRLFDWYGPGTSYVDIGCGDGTCVVGKSILQGPYMSNYMKPADFFEMFKTDSWQKSLLEPTPEDMDVVPFDVTQSSDTSTRITSSNGEIPVSQQICRGLGGDRLNKYVIGAINLLSEVDECVTVIPTLSNDDYDTLLSQNIVFVFLYDAAAVNTLIECIVRNTPIIVNRLPCVVEMLGDGYPLLYDEIEDLETTITKKNIVSAYNYLNSLDKSSLIMKNFMASFVSAL